MSATKRKRESEPNLVDDYSELCDALKAKYKMNEGDWKALLDLGMALYKRSPDEERLPVENGREAMRLIERIQQEIQIERAALARAEENQRAAFAEAHAAVAAAGAAAARRAALRTARARGALRRRRE